MLVLGTGNGQEVLGLVKQLYWLANYHELWKRLQKLDGESISAFVRDFEGNPAMLATFNGNPKLVGAWKVLDDAGVNKALRSDPDRLVKVNRYLENNPTKKDLFIDNIKNTSDPSRFVDRSSWVDDLKKQFDPNGNSANFSTHGLEKSDIPQITYDNMVTEASAPQFLDGVIKSGSTVPKKFAVSEGFTLYKVVPYGNVSPTPYTPYWAKLEEIKKYGAMSNFEQKMGLPVSSHGVKYDVYKIKVKTGEQVNIFESIIANTSEAGYTTSGGATQSLVLDRSKWTSPEIVTLIEIFPPTN